MTKFTTRDIAEVGIFVGLAIVLNLPTFKIRITPEAGSISFVIIPLFIVALRHNWWMSLIASSIIYGIPACLISGHDFVSSYFFDYMFAYSGTIILSLMKNLIMCENKLSYLFLSIACVLATLIRYIFATLSSVIFYEYKFIAALTYNALYVFISGAIGLIVVLILLKPLKIINQRYPNLK